MINLKKELILASQSPRRASLLRNLGLNFKIIPADINEDCSYTSPIKTVKHLSESKAKKVFESNPSNAIILAADTIVVKDKTILNKPINHADAFNMLRMLSGTYHYVYTGVSIIFRNNYLDVVIESAYEKTKVTFNHLTDLEINEYIKTGSPMDKAGAYGIQDDFGSLFIKKVEGCYYNVVGLPLSLLYQLLRKHELIIYS